MFKATNVSVNRTKITDDSNLGVQLYFTAENFGGGTSIVLTRDRAKLLVDKILHAIGETNKIENMITGNLT